MTYFNYIDMEDYLDSMNKFKKMYDHITRHLDWWTPEWEPTDSWLHYKHSGCEHVDTEAGEHVLELCDFTEACEYYNYLAGQDNALDYQLCAMEAEQYG